MSTLSQIDINFVIGLITAIVMYVHTHSWRKSQASGGTPSATTSAPSSPTRKPGEVPITKPPGAARLAMWAVAACVVVVGWVAIVACSAPQRAAEKRAFFNCQASAAASLAAKAATGGSAEGDAIVLTVAELVCAGEALAAAGVVPAGSGSGG